MKLKVVTAAVIIGLMVSCGSDVKKEDTIKTSPEVVAEEVAVDPLKNIGVGPISKVILGGIDQSKVDLGKELFTAKCAACHKVDTRFIGPALAGITERRTPEWIMNMIINPEKMVVEDPVAKQLLAEYLSPMANQDITEEEARLMLEYFRTLKAE